MDADGEFIMWPEVLDTQALHVAAAVTLQHLKSPHLPYIYNELEWQKGRGNILYPRCKPMMHSESPYQAYCRMYQSDCGRNREQIQDWAPGKMQNNHSSDASHVCTQADQANSNDNDEFVPQARSHARKPPRSPLNTKAKNLTHVLVSGGGVCKLKGNPEHTPCSECNKDKSCYWRRHPVNKTYICNPCGMKVQKQYRDGILKK